MAGNLHASARRGDFKGVQTMIEVYRDDVNALDVHGMTALHYASKRGHIDIVCYLVKAKGKLEIKNATGQTPLMAASQAGKLDCCEFLVASGADPNAPADHGVRPLHRASEAGHEEVVRLLLRGKADPLAVDEFMFEGAIHLAAREGHAEVLRCIMGVVPWQSEKEVMEAEAEEELGIEAAPASHRKRRLDDGNNKGETALHLAARNGRYESCKLLLTMGGTDTWRRWFMGKKDGRQQDTALHKACEAGHAEVSRLLLDHDSNPNTTNLLGRSPLHLATKAGSDLVVTYLLRAGANHLAVDHDGRRPVGAGNGPWNSPVPKGVESESASHLPTPMRKERARMNDLSNLMLQDSARQKTRRRAAQIKMVLTDIGTGAISEMQDFITTGRQNLAQNKRIAEKLRLAQDGFDEEAMKRIDKEAAARAKRMEVRRIEAEMEEIADRMRTAWAQRKVAAAWRRYKIQLEAERRERERQRRKAEAQRQRVLQASMSKVALAP